MIIRNHFNSLTNVLAVNEKLEAGILPANNRTKIKGGVEHTSPGFSANSNFKDHDLKSASFIHANFWKVNT